MSPSDNRTATTGAEQARTLYVALALRHNVYKYNAKQSAENSDKDFEHTEPRRTAPPCGWQALEAMPDRLVTNLEVIS